VIHRRFLGNWLYSREFGAWRNPNHNKPYQNNNRELWASFCAETVDASLRRALGAR
jgi:hypothetical protein